MVAMAFLCGERFQQRASDEEGLGDALAEPQGSDWE